MDTRKKAKTAYQVYDKNGGAALILVISIPLMIRVHQKVYVLVGNVHFFIFFLCYFCTNVVLRFFEYIPKSSYEIKLVRIHYKFTVGLGFCYIYFVC